MIDAREAVQIACDFKETPHVAGIMTNGRDYVVGFANANMPIFVDGQTGEAHAVGAREYAELLPELRHAE